MVTIMNAGLVGLAKLCNGTDGVGNFTYIALGTDDGAEDAADTTLGAEIVTNGGERSVCDTCSYEADYKSKWIHTFTFTGDLAVREMCIISAAADGTMLFRHLWAAVKNVANGETMQITVKLTYAEA